MVRWCSRWNHQWRGYLLQVSPAVCSGPTLHIPGDDTETLQGWIQATCYDLAEPEDGEIQWRRRCVSHQGPTRPMRRPSSCTYRRDHGRFGCHGVSPPICLPIHSCLTCRCLRPLPIFPLAEYTAISAAESLRSTDTRSMLLQQNARVTAASLLPPLTHLPQTMVLPGMRLSGTLPNGDDAQKEDVVGSKAA